MSLPDGNHGCPHASCGLGNYTKCNIIDEQTSCSGVSELCILITAENAMEQCKKEYKRGYKAGQKAMLKYAVIREVNSD